MVVIGVTFSRNVEQELILYFQCCYTACWTDHILKYTFGVWHKFGWKLSQRHMNSHVLIQLREMREYGCAIYAALMWPPV